MRVWIVDTGTLRDEAWAMLDPAETARAGQVLQVAAQRLFVASRAVQRAFGALILGVPAERVVIDRSCPHCGDPDHGKPRLAGAPDVDYSVSHSGTLVGLAYAPGALVGFDLEALDRTVDPHRLARRVNAPGEPPFPTGPGSDETARTAFLRRWARKEAVAKLTGHGISLPFPTFRVDGDTARLLGAPPLGWPERPVRLCEVEVDPAYRAALATTSDDPKVEVTRLNQLVLNLHA